MFYRCNNAPTTTYVWDKLLDIVREFTFTTVFEARRPSSRSYAEDREDTNGAEIAGGGEKNNTKRGKQKYELCDE